MFIPAYLRCYYNHIYKDEILEPSKVAQVFCQLPKKGVFQFVVVKSEAFLFKYVYSPCVRNM